MASASKISRQRHARQRQQEQMQNLIDGAEQQQAQQQAQGIPPEQATPQVMGGGGDFVMKVKIGTPTPAPAPAQEQGTPAQPAAPQVISSGGDFIMTAKVGKPTPTPVPGANPDDPNGLLMGSSDKFRMKVTVGKKSAGAPGLIHKIKTTPSSRNRGTHTVVRTGNPSNTRVTVTPKQGAPSQSVPQLQQQQQQQQIVPQQHTAQAVQATQATQATRATADVTVYLTCFDRPGRFRFQIDAVRAQTVQPSAVVTVVNPGHVQHDERVLHSTDLIMLRSNVNMGPWFRFTIAMEASSKYVCILDDDVIPGPRWLESAIARLDAAESDGGGLCIAVTGRVVRSDDSADAYDVGPHSPREEELKVDIGRQGWVLPTALLGACLQVPRQGDGRTGWGIHLAAAMQLQDVLTVVLPYDPHDKSAWGTLEPPATEYSVSAAVEAAAAAGKGPNLVALRAELYAGYRALGWKPLVVLDAEDAAT